jgi:hypothetical protein
VALVEVKHQVLHGSEETVDPEEVEDLILLLPRLLMVVQEMFLTQVRLLQDYKATTEDTELEVLEPRKLAEAVAELMKLEKVKVPPLIQQALEETEETEDLQQLVEPM